MTIMGDAWGKERVRGSLTRCLKCKAMSGLPGSTDRPFKISTKCLAKVSSYLARSCATVRHKAVGSLSMTSPRLKAKLEPNRPCSVSVDTKLDTMADFPDPGLPCSQRILGSSSLPSH